MNYIKNEKGYTMVLTIILMAVVTILGTALLTSLVSEIRINRMMEERSIATYLAQSGIEHGLKILENTPIDETPTAPMESIIVYNHENKIHEYKILQLSDSLVQAVGRIKVFGDVTRTVTINVHIQEGEIITIEVE